ncbi:hypothetical protein, partial [Bacillus stratosphericus]|uniref:hypothetical protein n=1 Tax=Bacillus stratosphericus TaxID=293386 RepID=UPI001CFA02E0
ISTSLKGMIKKEVNTLETTENPYKSGPVKEWMMSEDELAAYRHKHPPKPYKKRLKKKDWRWKRTDQSVEPQW